ncbi:MAG: KEOPS complex subunit Pcc1 [Candidatus Thermoplasmatota archaeon]
MTGQRPDPIPVAPPVHTASLRIRFPSRTEADRAGRALEPDNAGHVAWMVEGSDLVLEASADSVLGLVRTVDDVLGCLRVLEGAAPPQKP